MSIQSLVAFKPLSIFKKEAKLPLHQKDMSIRHIPQKEDICSFTFGSSDPQKPTQRISRAPAQFPQSSANPSTTYLSSFSSPSLSSPSIPNATSPYITPSLSAASSFYRLGESVKENSMFSKNPLTLQKMQEELFFIAKHGSGQDIEEIVREKSIDGKSVNIDHVNFKKYDWLQENKETPLWTAALHTNDDVISALLQAGANPDIGPATGRKPLHWFTATKESDVKVLQDFVNAQANVNITYGDGLTPLHEAAELGTREMVEGLIEAGADIHAEAWGDQTPLDFSKNNKDPKVKEILIRALQEKIDKAKAESLINITPQHSLNIIIHSQS